MLFCLALPFSASLELICSCTLTLTCHACLQLYILGIKESCSLSGIARLCLQIQAVTSVEGGNFSSPVIVELDGSSEPGSSSAVGITVGGGVIMPSVVVAFE